MASEEWAKRFLRLAGHWPKDTREPRGPEHMAKMKAARGPYSDPRDTYIARTIRWAFEYFKGKAPIDGSVGERGLWLAAATRGQAAEELALPEHSPGAA